MIKSETMKSEKEETERLFNEDHESVLLNYFVEEDLSRDCIIQAVDGYFLCHKLVLAAANSFFRQLLESSNSTESVLVVMSEYKSTEILEILASAYKCDFSTQEIKSSFFTECKPLRLEELIKQSAMALEEVVRCVRSKHDSVNNKELIEIEPLIMKQELDSPLLMVNGVNGGDSDCDMTGGGLSDCDWSPVATTGKKKRGRIKGSRTKAKRTKRGRKRKTPDKLDSNTKVETDSEEGKENINTDELMKPGDNIDRDQDEDLKVKEDNVKVKKKSKLRIPRSAYPLPCTFCGKLLKNRTMKSKHDKRCCAQISKKGPNICHLCGASFKFTSSLNHHLSINCENSCKICGQVFKSRFAQRDHLFYAHGQVVAKRQSPLAKEEAVERFQCDQCDKVYAKKYSLLAHVKKAHEDNNCAAFQCNECGKFMGTERSLTIHMSLHRPPELPCPLCGKLFHNKKYLDRHARQVHTNQSDMKFKCDLCGRGFAVKRHLEEHRNVHLNLKPYKCRWCDRVYQNSANQNAHERTSHREAYSSQLSSGYKRIQVKKNPPIETQ